MMSNLEVRDLTCAYDRHTVLRHLALTSCPSEVLVLIGPNGAGKTTLLKALARLIRPQLGTVLLAGQDMWQLSPRTIAQQVALAPQQEPMYWPGTVEHAVALGRAPHRGWLLPYTTGDSQVLDRVLGQTGLQTLRHRLISELSGGEQRRVILARALAQEPQILLLDEPTAHLDLKYQTEVIELVRHIAQQDGLTIVIALHDLNQAALCADRIALLHSGSLLALGRPNDVLTPDLLAQAYDVAVVVMPHPVYGTPLVVPLLDHAQESNHDTGKTCPAAKNAADQTPF